MTCKLPALRSLALASAAVIGVSGCSSLPDFLEAQRDPVPFPALTGEQWGAIEDRTEAYLDCVVGHAVSLDDGVSDAETIGAVAASLCQQDYRDLWLAVHDAMTGSASRSGYLDTVKAMRTEFTTLAVTTRRRNRA